MSAGVGGVLVFQHDGCRIVRAFGVSVPAVLLEEWVGAGKRHLIGQVEMYALLLARSHWSSFLDGDRAVFFIDHGGVQSSAVNFAAREVTWRKLLACLEQADVCNPYFA